MSYRPEGVSEVTLGPGTHPVWLTGIKRITDRDKLAKFGAQALFIATFKSVAAAVEKDLIIKFSGERSDHYAGLNIDRLHLAAGLEAPAPGECLDLDNLYNLLDGVELLLEVNDKGYANAVMLPEQPGEEVV
jgi:hypothetical protein